MHTYKVNFWKHKGRGEYVQIDFVTFAGNDPEAIDQAKAKVRELGGDDVTDWEIKCGRRVVLIIQAFPREGD